MTKYNDLNGPSAKPKLSTTGRRAETLKKDDPSFISSATIRPRRLATTPYTLPRTSATDDKREGPQHKKMKLTRCLDFARIHSK